MSPDVFARSIATKQSKNASAFTPLQGAWIASAQRFSQGRDGHWRNPASAVTLCHCEEVKATRQSKALFGRLAASRRMDCFGAALLAMTDWALAQTRTRRHSSS
jgi:hypothetical protein